MIDIGDRRRLVDVDEYPAEVEAEHADRDRRVGDTEDEHDDDRGLENQRNEQRPRQPVAITE